MRTSLSVNQQPQITHPSVGDITVEWVLVTPAIAREWLGFNQGNRNKRPRKIAAYVRDIRKGNFMVTGDSIKFDWNGRLIDGQHRLEAIIDADRACTILIVRNLDPKVQGVLDVNARRSAADALRFAGVDFRAKDIAAIARIAMSKDAGYLRNSADTRKVEVTNAEVEDWYEANPDVQQAAALATKHYKAIGCTPASLGYSALVLSRIDDVLAYEFFSSMANFQTDGEGDPRKALLSALQRMKEGSRSPGYQAEAIGYIFRAWNAWRDNKTLKIMRATVNGANGPAPIEIPEPR